jgi:hypothetical protein
VHRRKNIRRNITLPEWIELLILEWSEGLRSRQNSRHEQFDSPEKVTLNVMSCRCRFPGLPIKSVIGGGNGSKRREFDTGVHDAMPNIRKDPDTIIRAHRSIIVDHSAGNLHESVQSNLAVSIKTGDTTFILVQRLVTSLEAGFQ